MLQNAASPPKDRYCATKSTRILEPRSLRGPHSLAGSHCCPAYTWGSSWRELFADPSRLRICTAFKDGIIWIMLCKALPLQVNLSLPAAAKLCISATLNSTVCSSVGPKLHFFFTMTFFWVNTNFLYLWHAKGYAVKYGSNLLSETRGVGELG